jgi:hypothetical protein
MDTDEEYEDKRHFAKQFARRCILKAVQDGRTPKNAKDAQTEVKQKAKGVCEDDLRFLAEADYSHILDSCTSTLQDYSVASGPASVATTVQPPPAHLPPAPVISRENSSTSGPKLTGVISGPNDNKTTNAVMGNFNVSRHVKCKLQVESLTFSRFNQKTSTTYGSMFRRMETTSSCMAYMPTMTKVIYLERSLMNIS